MGTLRDIDKLCGRYNSRALQVKRVCRHCNIQPMDCEVAKDVEGLKTISQHDQKNAFYNPKLDIRSNPHGIHGMTPCEPLHLVDLGQFKYALEGFYICLEMDLK